MAAVHRGLGQTGPLRFRHDGALRSHYGREHFLCEHPACAHKLPDYIAFRDVLELKAHDIQYHVDKSQMTKQQLKQATTMNLSFLSSNFFKEQFVVTFFKFN